MAREFPRAVFLCAMQKKSGFPHMTRCHTLNDLIEAFEVYMQKTIISKMKQKSIF